jgi:hypothetical protein
MARLTRVITARLSPDEFERFRGRAAELGLTTSTLLRQTIVAASPLTATNEDVLLCELRAMRRILINLLYKIGTHATLTEESMRQLIHHADNEPSTRAGARFDSER